MRYLGRPGTALTAALLAVTAVAKADFLLISPSFKVYYNYGLVAGQKILVTGSAEIVGNLHSNGVIDLQHGSAVTGDVSAVGTITAHGTVNGTTTPGAPPLALPPLASEADLRQLADRVFEGDRQFTNAVIDDVVFVHGNIRIVGTLRGVGSLIATRDIRLEALANGSPAPPDPQSRISLIALNDIRIDKERAFRGVLYASRDVALQKDLQFEGVAIARRNLSVDKDSQIRFVDFDTTAPVVKLISPPSAAFLSTGLPTIEVSYEDEFSGLDLETLRFLLDGADRTADAQASATGLRFTPDAPLAEGRHELEIFISDHSANEGHGTFGFIVDTVPPSLAVTAPPATVTGDPSPQIAVSYSDATSGIDLATLQISLDGTPLAGCAAGDGSATCEPPELAAGAHTVSASVRDRAGNPSTVSQAFNLILDADPPVITLSAPANGQVVSRSPIEVRGTVTDQSAITSVTVNGQAATLTGTAFSAVLDLVDGLNAIAVVAADAHGNVGRATVAVTLERDTTPPRITIVAPAAGSFVLQSRPEIAVTFSDERGVDPSTLAFAANGVPLAVSCQTGEESARCTSVAALPDEAVTVTASIRDLFGNEGTASIRFVVDTAGLEISFIAPGGGAITREAEVEVSGTVSHGVARVEVNGVAAALSGTAFAATVPLREGTNMIVVLATKANGRTGTATLEVTRDLAAPIVRIDSPRDGLVSVNDRIAVTGLVNDIVTGGVVPRVLINGIEARVGNGAFALDELRLARGPNTIEAVATDAVGNTGRHAIKVTFQPPIGERIAMVSGNGQAGFVNQALAAPLIVVIRDGLGNPLAGRLVRFETTRNNGMLQARTGDEPARVIQVPTDGHGRASAFFTLGDTAGEGNNRVLATALSVAGEIEFCASAMTLPADQILMTMGDNQRGGIGQPLPMPLTALVVDKNGNPLPGVDVTFTVEKGGGRLDGAPAQVKATGLDGQARAVLTLGLEPGINNNVVTASYEGMTGLPATFTASGLAPGPPEATRFSGVVLDNAHTPIPGAEVTIHGTTLRAVTDEQGQFLLENVPVGHIHLHIDPEGSPRSEVFPPLAFETVTIAGQNNVLGQPILIPALDMDNSKVVGGAEDVTLTMEGVEGLSLTIFANSATFHDGSRTGRVVISQVHLDKVPMAPPGGAIFMAPAWTIQPHGVHFDPPARITVPNNGLPPGRVVEVHQFDHALNQFISVGKGTVSEDGATITTDPGFGITAAGWGGFTPPPPPRTCVNSCDDKNLCTRDFCENGTCRHVPLTGPACNDGLHCTINDRCQSGVCRGDAVEVRRVTGACVAAVSTSTTCTVDSNAPGRVEWKAPGGNPASGGGGSFSTTFSSEGDKVVTALCGSSSKTKSVTVAVSCGSITPLLDEQEITQAPDPGNFGQVHRLMHRGTYKGCVDGGKWCFVLEEFLERHGIGAVIRGRTMDISGPNDPDVKPSTCEAIIRDFTPSVPDAGVLIAPYREYVPLHIILEHERFHVSDFRNRVTTPTMNGLVAFVRDPNGCTGCKSAPTAAFDVEMERLWNQNSASYSDQQQHEARAYVYENNLLADLVAGIRRRARNAPAAEGWPAVCK